jgi:beta-lactamase regulating signal transducer with metallopeptidase domain
MHLLELLGYGVVLSWLALPLLVRAARPGRERDPARAHQKLLLSLILASVCLALPWLRSVLPHRAGTLAPVQLSVQLLSSHATPRELASGPDFAVSPFALLGAIWACSWAMTALGHLVSWLRLQGLLGRARPAAASLGAILTELASELSVPAPRLLVSDEASAPFSAGVLRPTVVLPATLCESLPEVSLRLILEHELWHVRRRDPLSHALTLAASTLFWWHPTARWLRRELLVMREAAVDAQVARRDRRGYADLLVQMASWVRFGRDFTHVSMDDTALSRRIALLTRPPGSGRRGSLRPLAVLGAAVLAGGLLAPSVFADPLPFVRHLVPGPGFGLGVETRALPPFATSPFAPPEPLAPFQGEIDACYAQARRENPELVIDTRALFEVDGEDFVVTSAHVPTPESATFQRCVEERARGRWAFPPPDGTPRPPVPVGPLGAAEHAMVAVPIQRTP